MGVKKELRRIHELLYEGKTPLTEGGDGTTPTSTGKGATSTDSSGQYISPGAWESGGILTKDGRKDDIGDIPLEVDIIGDDNEEITISVDDIFGKDPSIDVLTTLDDLVGGEAPAVAPPTPLSGDIDDDDVPDGDIPDDDIPDGDIPDEPEETYTNGKIHREDPEPERGKAIKQWRSPPCCEPCGNGMWKRCNTDDCIYGSIADCELVDPEGESNIDSLTLSNLWGDEI